MCGFSGFTGMYANREEIIKKMSERIRHRGPDMGGSFVYGDTDKNAVTLGFRRLSILDLSEAGAQPMVSPDKSVAVVFNGEIYNFLELKEILQKKGYVFHTTCDTEVLVYVYLPFLEFS